MRARKFLGLCIFIFLVQVGFSYSNPSAEYCANLGYKYSIISIPEGEVGMCTFPDGTYALTWSFLTGKEGNNFSYCKIKGYGYIFENSSNCPGVYPDSCVLCVLPNGEKVEAKELSEIENYRPVCIMDEFCNSSGGENKFNCPYDCLKPNDSIDNKSTGGKQSEWKPEGYLYLIGIVIFSFLIFLSYKIAKNYFASHAKRSIRTRGVATY